MTKKKSIKKNFFYNTLYQVFTMLTPFITAPYTARVLGADGVGLQSYVASITSYFVLVAALGTSTYGQREIARNRDDVAEQSKVFWEITVVRLLANAVVMIPWFYLIMSSEQYGMYYAFSTFTILGGFLDISWFYAGIEDFKTVVIRNFLIRIAAIVFLFVFVKSKEDILLYVAALAISTFAGNASMWFGLRKYVIKSHISYERLKMHFRETFVYFIPTIAVSVYNVLDKTMLGYLTGGTYENGYYEQASKLVNMAKSVVLSLNTVMYTRMSYLFKQERYDEIRDKLHKSIDIIIGMSMPMIAGLMAISKTFVPWFFGDGYDRVIGLIYIYMPLVLVIGLSNCLGQQYLTPAGLRAKSNKVIILGAVVNFVANMLLIPKYGSYGATIASVLAEVLILVLYAKLSLRQLRFKMIGWSFFKKTCISAVMFWVVYSLNAIELKPLFKLAVQVTSGVLIYSVLIIVSKDSLFYLVKENVMHIKKKTS